MTEIIDGKLYIANGPSPLTIVAGNNVINLTNIYVCEEASVAPDRRRATGS